MEDLQRRAGLGTIAEARHAALHKWRRRIEIHVEQRCGVGVLVDVSKPRCEAPNDVDRRRPIIRNAMGIMCQKGWVNNRRHGCGARR